MLKSLKKVKKIFIVALVICLLVYIIPIYNSNIYAFVGLDNGRTTIYQEGIEYNISLDENMNVIVEVNADNENQIITEIEGDGDFTFKNEQTGEFYRGIINELTSENIDAEVLNSQGKLIETYTDIEQLDIEDTYSGQIDFVLTPGVVITLAGVLSALITAGTVIVIGGILFIVVTKFISEVNSLSKANQAKAKDLYYKAYINGNKDLGSNIYVNNEGMKVTAAATYLKASNSNSVYSFSQTMAKAAITKMGYSATAVENHYDSSKATGGWFYSHYHPKIKSSKRPHSFFGIGKLAKNYGGNIG